MLVMSFRNDCSRRGLREAMGVCVLRLTGTPPENRKIFAKLFSGA